MSYYDSLSAEQKRNARLIVEESMKAGITNPYAIAGMLAIVSKESSFVPQSENLNYSAKRLVEVFKISPERAAQLAGKPEAIANAIYGGRYGNASNEGFKYRGRGYNQLTFKGNYDKFGKLIGKDLVSTPDVVNDPKVAAEVLIAYNKANIESLKRSGKLAAYNANDINDFKNTRDAVLAFYHATAGTGKSVNYVKGLQTSDTLGGMTKALNRVDDLFRKAVSSAGDFVKKKPLTTILLTATAVVAAWILIKYSGIGKSNSIVKSITT